MAGNLSVEEEELFVGCAIADREKVKRKGTNRLILGTDCGKT
jgi:hypothetical protein